MVKTMEVAGDLAGKGLLLSKKDANRA